MYRRFIFLLIFSIAGFLLGNELKPQEYIKNEIIIKPKNIKTIDNSSKKRMVVSKSFIKKFSSSIKSIEEYGKFDIFVIKTKENTDIENLVEKLKENADIKNASLNYIAKISETEEQIKTPDDPGFVFQYGLKNTGELYNPDNTDTATTGDDIKAVYGWTRSIGSSDTIIAVLDSGIALDHEDLKNKIIDGYNFVDDNDNPYDDNGHGTAVASIAAAETNNGTGMAGVSWNSLLMPIKVMDKDGNGSYLQIAAGIRYAADNGAKIINMSLGGKNSSFILKDACKYAYEKGVVIIAASGNTASKVLYPAAYDDYCIAVGASDYNDELAYFSNFGPSIDLVAPGVKIFTAVYDPEKPEELSNYGWSSGTSLATPFVSGAAALLLSYKPFLTVDNVIKLLKITADDVNKSVYPGIDIYMGYGRLNLKRLLFPFEIR